MSPITLGLILGGAAGCTSAALMMPLTFPEKRIAISAAFINRFCIGFLAATVCLPINPVVIGTALGLGLSLPDALVTKAYLPILLIGTVLGGLCGLAVYRFR